MLGFLIFISRLLNLLPRSATLFLGDAIGWIWFHVIRFRRNIVVDNLRLAFGGRWLERDIQKVALENFRHYGRTLMEILLTISWQKQEYLDNLVIEGVENVRTYLKRGEGGFFLTLHLGNWELAIAGAAVSGIPVDIVVKHARNESAEKFLQWYRRKTGAGIFLEEGTAKDILRSLSQGRFVGFILDQFMGPPIGLPVQLFGKLAGTAVALALLTEKKEVPIILAYSYRDSEGKVHVVFEPPLVLPPLSEDKTQRLFEKTQFFNDVLEAQIRRHPGQWLWIHRRWKAYKGEPRWKLKTALAPAALALALVTGILSGCASGGKTPTGIDLPPDPKVAIPEFLPPQEDGDGDAATQSPVTAGTPVAVPGVTAAKPKPSKKKRAVKAIESPSQISKSESKMGVQVLAKHKIPFEVGERLEVDLTFMALPAGRAILEVREGEPFNGRPTFHLWGNVLSSKIVDTFYHVDNTAESIVDAAALIPYKFLLHMLESHQKKETRVAFDHAQNKAHYWAKRLSEKWGNEDQDRVDAISPMSRDMFSAVFYARVLNFTVGQGQTFTVYENKQIADIDLMPVANELVNTKVGAFQCWKIRVTVKINNVLSPMGETHMWLSDDSKKYLVKFDTKLKVGSLKGELVAVRERK